MALSGSNTLTESNTSVFVRLHDSTGLFNALTNPEGYGLAADLNTRSNRRVNDIQYITLDFFDNGGDTPLASYTIEGLSTGSTDAEDLADGTNDFDITATEAWPVGVYLTKYVPYFTSLAGIIFTFTEDSKTVTVTNGSNLEDELVNVKYLIYNGTKYTISNIVNPASTSATITLTSAFEDTTVAAAGNTVYLGYEVVTYIAVKNAITDCLNNKIADMALETCGCNSTEALLNAVVVYDSIQRNMDAANYTQVSDILTYLDNFCTDSGCGCS